MASLLIGSISLEKMGQYRDISWYIIGASKGASKDNELQLIVGGVIWHGIISS